jgi:hypothetical protein
VDQQEPAAWPHHPLGLREVLGRATMERRPEADQGVRGSVGRIDRSGVEDPGRAHPRPEGGELLRAQDPVVEHGDVPIGDRAERADRPGDLALDVDGPDEVGRQGRIEGDGEVSHRRGV